MGEEGVVQCRSLLDGMDGQGEGSSSYLQHIISEGRCVVCNHSTFEEDMAQQAARNGGEQQALPPFCFVSFIVLHNIFLSGIIEETCPFLNCLRHR